MNKEKKNDFFSRQIHKVKVSSNALFALYFNSVNSNLDNLTELISLGDPQTLSLKVTKHSPQQAFNTVPQADFIKTNFALKKKDFSHYKTLRCCLKEIYFDSKHILSSKKKLYSRILSLQNINLTKNFFKKPKKNLTTSFQKYRDVFTPLLMAYKKSFIKKRYYFFQRKYFTLHRIPFRRGYKAFQLRRLKRLRKPFLDYYYERKRKLKLKQELTYKFKLARKKQLKQKRKQKLKQKLKRIRNYKLKLILKSKLRRIRNYKPQRKKFGRLKNRHIRSYL